jgi:hypothetical protein
MKALRTTRTLKRISFSAITLRSANRNYFALIV